MTDGELVRHTLAGRTSAYDPLVRKWAARVLALCHARVGRADVAEELAQETLVRGLEGPPSLADPARFGPWVRGIAANVCSDWLKPGHNRQEPPTAPPGAAAQPAAPH